MDQDDQGRRHHQLVGDRVEEGAECRGFVPAAGQIAVEPIGDCGEDEDHRDGQVTADRQGQSWRQVIDGDHQRNQADAQPGQEHRDIEWHQCRAA